MAVFGGNSIRPWELAKGLRGLDKGLRGLVGGIPALVKGRPQRRPKLQSAWPRTPVVNSLNKVSLYLLC